MANSKKSPRRKGLGHFLKNGSDLTQTYPALKTPGTSRNIMNHTTCPLCSKSVAWNNIHKHFFSAKHIDQFVIPALKKEKGSHRVWRASTIKSANPVIYYGQEEKGLHICFGCKTVKQHLPSYHLRECPHATDHIDTLKKLLGDETEEEVEDVGALKKKIETLEKKIKYSKIEEDQMLEQLEEYRQFMTDYFKEDFDDMSEDKKKDLIEEGYKGNIL